MKVMQEEIYFMFFYVKTTPLSVLRIKITPQEKL